MQTKPVPVNPTPVPPIKPTPIKPVVILPQTHYASITCYKKQQLINAAVQLASNGFIVPNVVVQPKQTQLQANVDAILNGLAKMFNIVL